MIDQKYRTNIKSLFQINRLTIYGLFFIMASLLFLNGGCSSSDSVKLGFLYSSDITERYVSESNYFAQRAKELGAEVIVRHADNNHAMQYQIAMEMVDEGIDLLVIIAVNAITANAIVRDVKDSGVPVIAYSRLIPNSDLDMFVTQNNHNQGLEKANYVMKLVPRGNYMIFAGDKFDRNAIELQSAVDLALEPGIASGDINIIYKTYTEDWSGVNAAFELRQYLSNSGNRPDAIISSYDGMTRHMIGVLRDFNLAGLVVTTGQDAELASIKEIVAGNQHLTFYHPLRQSAYLAAEIAVAMVSGNNQDVLKVDGYTDNGFKQVPIRRINSILVSKDNIDKVLIEGGVYAREDIY